MLNKLKMCWFILVSKDYTLHRRYLTYLDGTQTIAVQTIFVVTESKVNDIIKIEKKMDSAVDEVNQILKGKV